jgi:hypothetical protein
MFLNIASRWALVRLNLRPDFMWRMAKLSLSVVMKNRRLCPAFRGYPLFQALSNGLS